MIIGDVYRRDEVNRTHHAAFHQAEVVQLYREGDQEMAAAGIASIFDRAQREQTEAVQAGYSLEASKFVERQLKKGAGTIGWALGCGLERLAMLYYDIPDIRLFWSRDSGFLHQFEHLEPFQRVAYRPISVYPQKRRAVLQEQEWSANDVHAIILDIGGEMVEQAHLVEAWTHPKDGRTSNMYRIVYRSMERALTSAEVNVVHGQIEAALVEQLGVTIR
ncbi:Phenylalanyl-tRNA synthetase [Tyrophagus putrescentiae]|nr:Phenylalanyl-tRNA synthetase [Tyrophagus putrescentiae]